MEDYRFGTEITASTNLTQLLNAAGESELFYTDGTGGTSLYNVRPDSGSDTGWSVTRIPNSNGPGILAGGAADGVFTLFTVGQDLSNPVVLYLQRDAAGSWGTEWQRVDASSVQQNPAYVAGMTAEVVDGALQVAVVLAEGDSGYGIWRVDWKGAGGWTRLGSVLGPFVDFCTTHAWGAGLLAMVAGSGDTSPPDLQFFPLAGGGSPQTLGPLQPSSMIDSALQAPPGSGVCSGIFIYTPDIVSGIGSVSFIDCGQQTPAPVVIDPAFTCQSLVAIAGGANPLCMAALNVRGQMLLLAPDGASLAGAWRSIPLEGQLASMSAGLGAGGAPLVFGVMMGGNALLSVQQQPQAVGGAWTRQEISAQERTTEMVPVYGTTFTLVNAQGNTLPYAAISVTSGQTTALSWKQQTFTVGPGVSRALTTDAGGQVTLYAPTQTINGAKLLFSSEGVTPAGMLVPVDVDDGVRARLKGLGQAEFTQLIPPAYAQDAGQVYQGIQTALSYDSLPGTPARLVSAAGLAGYERPLDPRSGRVPHWSFTVQNGRATFAELTAADAASLRAGLLSGSGVAAADLGGFFEWLGNIVSAAVNFVQATFHAVVELVSEVVQATIHCVVDGVTYLFDGAIHTLERAFQVVEGLFASVAVKFDKLFDFVGWLLSDAGADIWHTKQQFETVINGSFASVTAMLQSGESASADFFAQLRQRVTAQFQSAIQSVGATTFNAASLGTMPGAGAAGAFDSPSEVISTLAGNLVPVQWFYEKLSTGAGDPGSAPSLPQSVLASVEKLSTQLQATVSADIQNELQAVQRYLAGAAASPEDFARHTLAALLETAQGVVLAVLDVLDAVTQTFFEVAIALVGAAKANVFDVNIGGWFLGPLYNLINPCPEKPEPLTVTGLVAMLAAFPATILYRLLEGQAPFATGVAGELGASGPNTFRQLAGLATCALWAPLDVMLDARPPGVPLPWQLGVAGAAVPVLLNGLLAPGAYPFTLQKGDTPQIQAANAFWKVKWLPIVWVFAVSGTKGFTGGPRGVAPLCMILSILGVATLGAGIAKGAVNSADETAAGWILDIVPPLVTSAKFLGTMKEVPEALVALLVIDSVGDLMAGATIYVANS